MLTRVMASQEGQTLAEYALILVLILLVVVAAVALLGGAILAFFASVPGSF